MIDLPERCRIHAGKMDGEGWYVTANVLAAAADEIDKLRRELEQQDKKTIAELILVVAKTISQQNEISGHNGPPIRSDA